MRKLEHQERATRSHDPHQLEEARVEIGKVPHAERDRHSVRDAVCKRKL
jgi:hypothetical protein